MGRGGGKVDGGRGRTGDVTALIRSELLRAGKGDDRDKIRATGPVRSRFTSPEGDDALLRSSSTDLSILGRIGRVLVRRKRVAES